MKDRKIALPQIEKQISIFEFGKYNVYGREEFLCTYKRHYKVRKSYRQ